MTNYLYFFIYNEILLFCYIYIVGQGAREGGKVGQDDHAPPQSLGPRGSPGCK